ncbi:MAG: hypothetical protein II244_01540 [Clostridia bacterium]|nr:hypothetical protein [Clostridia bacterium]
MADTTEALTVSIQAETTARIDAVSLAISTTEAYTDSVVSVATEATRAYADSIVSTATIATEAYTDSVLQSATTAINTTIGDLSQLDTSVKSSVTNAINSEVSARQGADNNLQTQIDGLAAASDVTDIVGTYAELQAYDTQHLNDNDIIKVLSDSTHQDQPSYYRFDKETNTFSYIGSEDAGYTKAQADAKFVTQTTTINGKALSQNITLTATEVGALPSDTTINDLTTTAQQNAINSTATTAKINQIATNTTNIASNTSAISTINGKIPTDASSSNKLVSAASLAVSIADFANQDLSNLTSNGEARLHALKAYADNGELLQDADGLSFVKNYAHSTFDRSKFTVVGSPNITDDGIASGFSNSNYLTKSLTVTSTDTLRVETEFTYNTLNQYQRIIYFGTSQLRIMCSESGVVGAYIGGGTAIRAVGKSGLGNPTDGALIRVVLEITATTADFWVYVNDILKYHPEQKTGQTYSIASSVVQIGAYGGEYFAGSIDLKQFSITVDGVEVFSGNKTGIDTIKSDDYTVAGTPTVSADGIASGFSGSKNILSDSYVMPTGTYNFDIYGKFKTNTLGVTQDLWLSDYSSNTGVFLQLGGSGALLLYITPQNSTTWAEVARSSVLQTNTTYYARILQNNGTISLYLGTSEDNLTLVGTPSSNVAYFSTAQNSGYKIRFGCRNNGSSPFLGSIDLNAFKVYVNGSLVYQPCLKIPYTESKTGSKIVDSVYRDRVADMYGQYGYAPYYTLDEDKGNFTLPQVELYGLIQRQSFTPSDKYDNLTLGASGSKYTAPSDGYFMLNKAPVAAGEYAVVTNEANGLAMINAAVTATNNIIVRLGVKKNDEVTIVYTATGSTNLFRFIYSVGSESEAN